MATGLDRLKAILQEVKELPPWQDPPPFPILSDRSVSLEQDTDATSDSDWESFDESDFVTNPGSVFFNGISYPVHDYLGDEYTAHIETLNSQQPATMDMLSTELLLHQKYGVAKVMHLFRSQYRGGILGDEMGLGQILLTLAAIMADGKDRRGCCSLVIAGTSVIPHWLDECKLHFKKEYKPRTLWLDNTKDTALDIIKGNYDIIFVTPQFVEHQFRLWTHWLNHREIVETEGLDCADKQYPDIAKQRRLNLSLYSTCYRTRLLPFKHVVIDEAQYGKNENGSTHQAFRNLYRDRTLLLSDKFLGNRWTDVFSLMDLLPGHPFVSRRLFDNTFGGDPDGPKQTDLNLLTKFLMGIVVARPNSVLKLPKSTVFHRNFELGSAELDLVEYYMLLWYRAIKRRRQRLASETIQETSGDSGNGMQILGLILKAQVFAGHLKIAEPSKEREQSIRSTVNRFRKYYAEQVTMTTKTSLESEVLIPDSIRSKHAFLMQENLNLPQSIFDERKKKSNNKRAWVPRLKPQALIKKRAEWLKKVKRLADEAVYSSRINAVLEVIMECGKKYKGERIVVFSKFLGFLDILNEALVRHPSKSEVWRFDGTMSAEDRLVNKHAFNECKSDRPKIILVTPGAGGASVSLEAASIVVQTEVWWSHNEELKAWSQVRGPAQQKEVKIYVVAAENSLVDYHVTTERNQKADVIDRFMRLLRRTDDEEPQIPDITPWYN